jgi:hypothetical protein
MRINRAILRVLVAILIAISFTGLGIFLGRRTQQTHAAGRAESSDRGGAWRP